MVTSTASKQSSKWVHLTAIGGTGMGALAALLQDLGWQVTGSDGPLYPPMSTFLESRRIPLRASYGPENLRGETWGFAQARPDLVIIGNAISRTNLEAQAVDNDGINKMSFAQALAEFCICDRRSFVVAGTHGKTTTTSVLAWCLESLGRKPGFFIGGIPLNFGQGCRTGEGAVFVTEGDEYDTAYWDKGSKFLHYRPSWVLCTGVEFDHADIFKNVEAIEDSFLKLVGLTKEGWVLVDDTTSPRAASVRRLSEGLAVKGVVCHRYGHEASSRYRLIKAEAAPMPHAAPGAALGTRIEFECPELGRVTLHSPMTGLHNALNVVGVAGTLLASGEARTLEDLERALAGFKGVKRRQEEIHASQRLVVIDDFAHHPTAIRETLRAIRARYPGRSVGAFFEPRSATSARNVMAADFASCFDDADGVFLVPPTKTNIPEAEKLDVAVLVREIGARPANKGKVLVVNSAIPELAQAFSEWRQGKPALALVMSNGPFGGIHGMLAAADRG